MYINSENPLFIYSAGANDFFTYIQAGPVELLNKKVREKLPNNLEELVVECVDNVENNWLLLYKLNNKVKIEVLSFFYSPLFHIIQWLIFKQEKINDKGKKYYNRFAEIIDLYNSLLEERSKKYDFIDYVDITFVKDYCVFMDFHPNTEGNKLIANKIIKVISEEKNIKSFNI